MDLDWFRVRPGNRLRLDRFSPASTRGLKDKADGRALMARNLERLTIEQARLFAQDQYALLVIFQAMDAAGKDSTIKHVMSGVDPQGVHVTSFKAPSSKELDHDYLWRSVVALPERRMIGIHNRSYYEEVLVVRVHEEFLQRQRLPSSCLEGDIWARRFRQINQFERHLVENGTVVLKFFLHVSKVEQRRRFLDRIAEPDKNWKFSMQDVKERAYWKNYERAYEAMLDETSTRRAPWYVIPADHKWYMQAAVGHIIAETLRKLPLKTPAIDAARKRELADAKKALDGGA
jgi:PPK2 family polyphosphate:nucleotide phosphotransferase